MPPSTPLELKEMSDENTNQTCIVAGKGSWSRRVFDEVISHYPGRWRFIQSREELTLEAIRSLDPRYIFFLHWSWRVPEGMVDTYECIAFHMTDLPYGRGGTPLQNLIIGGHKETKLTAFRMTRDFDAGPIYMKANMGLEGNAEEIYLRVSYLAAEMIKRIVRDTPRPEPQKGEVVVFRRRKPEESEISDLETLPELFDFIRMLDAEGYPRAFLVRNRFRYEFHNASLRGKRITTYVTITPIREEEK